MTCVQKLVERGQCLTLAQITEALAILKGAVTIVYPMGLPPHEPVRQELDNKEILEGTQASLEVIPLEEASLWWAGKELTQGRKLKEFLGNNDKTKIVAKLHKRGQGAPAREPTLSEDERKKLMLMSYQRQEELKKLESTEDDDYLNSPWADNQSLHRSFHGLNNIKWKP
ncbi:C21orf59 [Cordylochernes scorpioides]|uniref:C21orf59 n=1 Tax=Cordylochernes scorpioides TaxID=51811 RepID=A0ABY6LA51_9ARAC|nr:C21orf59 [Cordylochernes scorpioides]